MKTGRKNARNSKKINLGSGGEIFKNISAKSTNFEISSLVLRIFDEVSVSSFKSRFRNFWWSLGLEVLTALGLEGYGLDYITAI